MYIYIYQHDQPNLTFFTDLHSSILNYINYKDRHDYQLSIISKYQQLSIILNHYQSLSIIINHYQSFSIILNHSQSLSIIINHYQSLSIIINHYQSLSIILNHSQSFSIILNHSQSFSIIINHYQSLSIIINHYQSLSIIIISPFCCSRVVFLAPRQDAKAGSKWSARLFSHRLGSATWIGSQQEPIHWRYLQGGAPVR